MMKQLLFAICQLHTFVNSWTHTWENLYQAQFIDFTSNRLFSTEQAEFVASHYKIVSMEKCTGQSDGLKTEVAIWKTAAQLKAINPDLKVMFYLNLENQGLPCYAAYDEFMANPSWWLKNDDGQYINSTTNLPEPDFTVEACRDWWLNIPFNGTRQNTPIDGVLADSPPQKCPSGLGTTSCEAYQTARDQTIQQLNDMLNTNGTGEAIANGIFMYTGSSFPSDYGLFYLDYANGVMVEHVAVFEVVQGDNLNIAKMQILFSTIEQAIATNKTVIMNVWPGLLVQPNVNGMYSWPEDTPQTPEEWRAAYPVWHDWAVALYLTLAEENVFMQYQGWYMTYLGGLPCDIAPQNQGNNCNSLNEADWYKNLSYSLGAPLGPYSVSGTVYTREFQNASVYLDLWNPQMASVTFYEITI